jgi:hypothetical protein
LAEIHWASPVNGDFSTAADWSGGVVPGPGDDAFIDPSGTYAVTISTPESVQSLTVNDAGATAVDNGALTVGKTLMLTAGTLQLNPGGSIVGGTLSATGGAFVWKGEYTGSAFIGGTLSGVTYDGVLNLSAPGSDLEISDGLTLTGADGTGPGVIDLTGDSSPFDNSNLTVTDTETLDNATLDIGNENPESANVLILGVTNGPNTILTLGKNFHTVLVGANAFISSSSITDTGFPLDTLVNDGSIVASVSGGNFGIITLSFTNNGSITVSNGDNFFAEQDTFSNAGTVTVGSGGAFWMALTNIDTGLINLNSGGSLVFENIMTTAQLEALDMNIVNNGGTISFDGGMITNTGATLNVGPGTPFPALALEGGVGPPVNGGNNFGGKIIGGTVEDEGSGLKFGGGGLSGVTYEGTLDLSATDSSLFITGGLTATGLDGTGPGTIDLTGDSAALYVDDTETWDNATLNIGGGTLLLNDTNEGNALTLGSHFDVVQVGQSAQITSTNINRDTIVNDGDITAAVSGGDFQINPANFTNNGSITASNDDVLSIQASGFSNLIVATLTGGRYEVDADSTLQFNGGAGIYIDDATIILSGAGSTIQRLNSQGAKLSIDQTLSSIGANGTLELLAGRNWTSMGGMTNAGTLDLGGGTFAPVVLANTGTVSGDGVIATIIVNRTPGVIDADGAASLALHSAGAIVVNSGLIESTGSGGLIVRGATLYGAGGVILAANGSAVTLDAVIMTGGTVETAGTGAIIFQDSGLLNGVVQVDAAAGGAIDNEGKTVLLNGSVVTVQGEFDNTGEIGFDGFDADTSLVVGAAGVSLSGGGLVILNDVAENIITGVSSAATLTNVDNNLSGAGRLGAGSLTLINEAAGVIVGSLSVGLIIDTGANTIDNAGVILARGAGGVTIQSAVANSGLLEAAGGVLTVNGEVSGTGAGMIYGGTLDLASGFTQRVVFQGTTGVLELAQSQGYTGTITGFSKTGGTSLDLGDIAFVSSTEATFSGTASGGMLTVTDGTHTAHISLKGDYLASTFTASSDGHGGTIVVDPTAGSAVSAHRFIAAAATLGAGLAGHAGMARDVWRLQTPMLARPATA